MAKWAELPNDLIALIAKCVNVLEDFVTFGNVCKSWRTAATKEKFDVFAPQIPLLMLADKNDDYREFYSESFAHKDLLASQGCGEGLIWSCVERAVLSASPSLISDYVLLVYYYGCGGHLAFWRPRDLNWTNIIGDWCGLSGINYYYKGQFYSVSWKGKVWVFDVAEPQPLEPRLLVRLKDEIWNRHSLQFYLVELVGLKPLKGNNAGIQFKSWPQKQR
ncbi:hypothetical protein P3S67_003124 [Capsicum chacoense]